MTKSYVIKDANNKSALKKFHKVKWDKGLLGKEVSVLVTSLNSGRLGFEINKIYKGKLNEKVDWLVGCPVFEHKKGNLGLGYECILVEESRGIK